MALTKLQRPFRFFAGPMAAVFLVLLCALALPAGTVSLEPSFTFLHADAHREIQFRRFAQFPAERLNLLLITVDTLRADRVSSYASFSPQPAVPLRTPNIDGLAAQGTVFARAFAHNATTLPSHASILLGVTPSYHGVHDNANFVVGPEFLTLAEHLQAAGYATGAFISGFPLDSRYGLNQGFAVYDDRLKRSAEPLSADPGLSPERRAEEVLAAALAWLEVRSAPWFLWIHFWDPHDPYAPPEPYNIRFAGRPYDGEVAYVDATLGNLFKAVGARGFWGNTLIVLTADHGESLGEHGERTHGFLAYNTTLWVPLVIFHPGFGHRIVSGNVSHVDVFPTVCDLLGLSRPSFLQGNSLVPVMKGKKPADVPIYFESLSAYYNMGWAPIRGFVRGREKFVNSPIPEIYDLVKDFGETKNLVDSGAAAAARKTLIGLIGAQSSDLARTSARASDRETLERLRSLGYAAGPARADESGGERFGPEDDVKTLLPFYDRAMDALGLFLAGRTRESIETLKQILAEQPALGKAYLNLAFIYRSQGRAADAAAILKTGLEARPRNYEIFSQLVACLFEAGDFAQAARVFDSARLPQVESDPVIWNYVGLAWSELGDEKRAKEDFARSRAIDSRSPVPWCDIGNLHSAAFKRRENRARLKDAAEGYRKALALDASFAAAHHGLGVVLFWHGDLSGAIASLEKALALDPRLHEALYFLGLARYRNGENAEACACLVRYRTTPDFDRLSPADRVRIDDILAQCKK